MISQFDQWTTPGGCDHYRWDVLLGKIIWIFYGRHSRYSLSYMKRQMQSMLKVRNAPWSLFLLGLFQEPQRCLYDKLEAVLANGISMATQQKCMTSRIAYLKTSLLLNGLILIPISSSSRISRKILKQRLSMNVKPHEFIAFRPFLHKGVFLCCYVQWHAFKPFFPEPCESRDVGMARASF